MDYVKILQDLATQLVEDKENLKVVERSSLEDNEVLLYVYASETDISRLIGKKGSMASAIRHVMSVPGRLENKKVVIKFESYEQ